ncbi:hypothetical protein MKW98_029826 [Papaver atlanticum]|uniref:Polyphenol oxidase C-terminal domain-containing protein n=1 Tax=Papaver atlanticum TaxID=357466 RepID=A0AAD4TJW4_9MAGN|nr:hypothetical protein MKW98_029826 [Papaver atlanticum]
MSLSYLASTTISSPTTIYGKPLRRSEINTCGSVLLSNRTPYTSCEFNQQNQEPTRNGAVDRRNVLLGLGGLYGSTAAVANNAFGKPLPPFDSSTCHPATDGETKEKINCCPVYSTANMVKDCLTPESLGYSYNYDSSETHEWATIRRKYKKLRNAEQMRSQGDSRKLNPVSEFGSKPRNLTEPIQALVQRPKTSRTKDEKQDSVEVLFIEGVHIPHGSTARFDIYLTKPTKEGQVGRDNGEFAGSFVKVPHAHHESSDGADGYGSSLELGISALLEDIDAETSEKLVVSLIPRNGEVIVGGVQIGLVDVNYDDNV